MSTLGLGPAHRPGVVFGNEPLKQSKAWGCAEMNLDKLGLGCGKLMQVRLNLLAVAVELVYF